MRPHVHPGLLVLVELLVAACAVGRKDGNRRSPTVVARPMPERPSGVEDLLVRLERTACFGACPAYVIKVNTNGVVKYIGRDCVRNHGSATRTLSVQELKDLRQAIDRAGLNALPDPCCRCGVEDSSSALVGVRLAGKWTVIEDNLGCDPPTTQLRELEDAIDRIVQSEQWVGADADRTGCLRL
jgi:hypothetical protein